MARKVKTIPAMKAGDFAAFVGESADGETFLACEVVSLLECDTESEKIRLRKVAFNRASLTLARMIKAFKDAKKGN